MFYLIGIIAIIIIALLFIKLIKNILLGFLSLITLGFLPSGIERLGFDHPLFDGKITTVVIPLIGHIINYFNVLIINVVDFILYFLSYIPLINSLFKFVYTSPDAMEHTRFNAFTYHRNFITHSMLNPVIIILLVIYWILYSILKEMKIKHLKEIFGFILSFSVLLFSCHLLADSMPKSWIGFASIKLELFGVNFLTFNKLLSKAWLLINGYIGIILGIWILSITNKNKDENNTKIIHGQNASKLL